MTFKDFALIALTVSLLVITLFMLPIRQAHSQVTSVTVSFTAPGDDGVVGTATSYDLRWSTVRPDTTSAAARTSWWNTATRATNVPAPKISGTAETFTVPGSFTTGTAYYFVVIACDEVSNCSNWSNVATKTWADTIPPSAIFNLAVQ